MTPAAEKLKTKFHLADRAQSGEDLRKILATEEGRRFLLYIVGISGVYGHTQSGDNLPYLTGRRDLGIEILHDANDVAPEQVLRARQERHETISARNQQIRAVEEEELKPKEKP